MFWFFLFLISILVFNLATRAFWLYEKGKQPHWEHRFYQITWGATRYFLVEVLCTLVLIVLYLAGLVWWIIHYWAQMPRKVRTPRGPGDRPVILCHGYQMWGWCLGILALWLRSMGRTVISLPDFGPGSAGIRHYGKQLRDQIRQVLRETQADSVDLVGHSMGGLIARACLTEARRSGDLSLRVAHLVTLGTPHQGTNFWVFTRGECGLDMKPNSSFLNWLGEDPTDVNATIIWSDMDDIVHEESAKGWNASEVKEVHVSGLGHVALSMVPSAARAVFEAING